MAAMIGGSDMSELIPTEGMQVLAYCCHEADMYHLGDGKLTPYGSHCEGLGHVDDGLHVIEYHEGYTDRESYESAPYYVPPGWFLSNCDGEIPANPITWWPLPDVEESKKRAHHLIQQIKDPQ